MPRIRRGKSFIDDSDQFTDDDSNAAEPHDPASKYRLVFGGRTENAILSGKRFSFSPAEKTTMFREAINRSFSRANLPSPDQLLHLARQLNIPLQPNEMTEVCLKKVLDWIVSNVNPEKTKGLIIEQDKGYRNKEIKVSQALVETVNDPAFSFKWLLDDKKMKRKHNATGGLFYNVKNRNELGRTALLAAAMSELATNPPSSAPSQSNVTTPATQPMLLPPTPAPLVYGSPAPVYHHSTPVYSSPASGSQAKPTAARSKFVIDSDSPSEDSDSDAGHDSIFSPVAAVSATPHTAVSHAEFSPKSSVPQAVPAAPHTPTPAPKTVPNIQHSKLSSDAGVAASTPSSSIGAGINHQFGLHAQFSSSDPPGHLPAFALSQSSDVPVKAELDTTKTLHDYIPLKPIRVKHEKPRQSKKGNGPLSGAKGLSEHHDPVFTGAYTRVASITPNSAADSFEKEVERLWLSLRSLGYTKEQARHMVMAKHGVTDPGSLSEVTTARSSMTSPSGDSAFFHVEGDEVQGASYTSTAFPELAELATSHDETAAEHNVELEPDLDSAVEDDPFMAQMQSQMAMLALAMEKHVRDKYKQKKHASTLAI